jgi:hypothetical protein
MQSQRTRSRQFKKAGANGKVHTINDEPSIKIIHGWVQYSEMVGRYIVCIEEYHEKPVRGYHVHGKRLNIQYVKNTKLKHEK